MFRPYMLAIFRLRFNLKISYTRCVGCFLGVGGELMTPFVVVPNYMASIVVLHAKELERIGKEAMVEYSRC